MTRQSYFFTIFLLVFSALVISVIVFPSQKEESLMYFYDRRYEHSYEQFLKLYNAGDRSPSVVTPLIWLDQHFANTNHAAKVLQEYVENNPHDREAKEYLSELLRDMSRTHHYLSVKKQIYGMNPPEDVKSYEQRLYEHLGDFDEQKQQLNTIVTKGIGSQDHYIELAYIQSSEGKIEEALKTIEQLINSTPLSQIKQENFFFILRAFLDFDREKQALTLAKNYLQTEPEFAKAYALLDLFDGRGYNEFVLEMIKELPKNLQTIPEVEMSRAKQIAALGKPKRAYQYLKSLYGNTPPKKIQKYFFLLALEQEEAIEELAPLVKQLNNKEFNTNDLYEILQLLIIKGNYSFSKKVLKHISPEYYKENKTLDLAIDLALNPSSKKQEELIESFHDKEAINDSDKVFLASLYQHKNYEWQAKNTLGEIESLEEIPPFELYELSKLFLDLHMTDKGLELIEELREENPPKESEVDEAWILLASEEELVEEVIEFLEEEEEIDEYALIELFYKTVEKDNPELALSIARALCGDKCPPRFFQFMGLALILNDQVDEGLKLFHEVVNEDFVSQEEYLFALSQAAKREEKYRPLLKKMIEEQLSLPQLSEQQKRNYAYILLENSFNIDAASLFYSLAEKKEYESGDVQTLLAAWGEKPTDEQLEWIAKKAGESTDKEKGQWLQELLYKGNPGAVLSLVEPKELEEETIAEAYIGAASELRNKELIADAVTYLYPRVERLPRLKELGVVAKNAELYELAKKIYKKILEEEPSNSETLEALGVVYYYEGAYYEAKSYFIEFLRFTKEDSYTVNYYLGEILETEHKKCLAKAFYKRALYLLDHHTVSIEEEKEEEEKQKLLTKAALLEKLHRPYEAIALYNSLLVSHPKDPLIRIDFANLMMSLQGFRSASRLLDSPLFNKKSLKKEDLAISYAIAWARLLRETNHIIPSVDLLLSMRGCADQSPELYTALADSFYTGGKWRRANNYMNLAIKKNPHNEEYRRIKKEIVWDHKPYANVNFEYRVTGFEQREHFWRGEYAMCIAPFTLLGYKYDLDTIHLNDLQRLDNGEIVDFEGVRTRGEIFCKHDFLCGSAMTGRLYFTEGILGMGAEWKKTAYTTAYHFGVDFHKVDWENIQSTIEGGTRDRVYLEQEKRFNRFVEWVAGFELNRYNLHNFSSAALSWKFESILTYELQEQNCLIKLLGEETEMTLNYLIDKEQVERRKKKIASDGEEFTPLPLQNREIHSLYGFFSKRFNQHYAIEAYFGYLYDRVAKGSLLPVGGAAVTIFKKESIQARLDYNHSVSTENVQETVDSYMINFHYVY